MLRKDLKKAAGNISAHEGSTADPAEIARFNALADEWWNPDGAFKQVHAFNKIRVAHLSQRLPQLIGNNANTSKPLENISMVDVGCAAGIVTEPMANLGASILGIDASERNIMVARRHAEYLEEKISYEHMLPEDLLAGGETYDIVMSLEVVEHVIDLKTFVEAIGSLVRPGGILVIGTLNRTPLSYVKAIIGAEYVLGWLPKGTHDWRKFVKPTELNDMLAPLGFSVEETAGVELNPLTMRWSIANRTDTNYLQYHRKAG